MDVTPATAENVSFPLRLFLGEGEMETSRRHSPRSLHFPSDIIVPWDLAAVHREIEKSRSWLSAVARRS